MMQVLDQITAEHTLADGSAPSTDISVAAEPATAPDTTPERTPAEVEPIVSAASGATRAIADCIAGIAAQFMDAPKGALVKLTDEVLEHRGPMSPKDQTELTKIADLILFHKDRTRKSPTRFVECLRWCDATRQRALNDKGLATEQASDESTESEVLSEDEVTRCFAEWSVEWMYWELDRRQRKLSKFRVKTREDGLAYLTLAQKSFMNNILRNRLGSKFVAMRIWTIGLPQMCRAEKMAASNPAAWRRGVEQLVDWFAKLVDDVVRHQGHEAFAELQRASSGCAATNTRMRELRQAAQANHRRGKRLRDEMDAGSIDYDSLSPRDQLLKHNYDTGRSAKRIKFFKAGRLPAFRSTI